MLQVWVTVIQNVFTCILHHKQIKTVFSDKFHFVLWNCYTLKIQGMYELVQQIDKFLEPGTTQNNYILNLPLMINGLIRSMLHVHF